MNDIFSNSNFLIGESLLSGEAFASEFRSTLVTTAAKGFSQQKRLPEIIRSLVRTAELLSPIFAETFWKSDLAAWLAAFDYDARKLPRWLKQHLREFEGQPPSNQFDILNAGEDEPSIRFAKIEKAAESLRNRGLLSDEDFKSVSDQAKSKAFSIAGDLSDRSVEKIRDTLAELIDEGASLPEFERRVTDRIGKSPLGPGRLETIYRTNVQSAFRDGRESLLQNPIVSDIFPYQEYIPIHDARARHNHLALGRLGLDGTGVYRRDDPFWDFFTPPWDYNCRCAVNLLTVEAAARKGVTEAVNWLQTGRPPETPEHRLAAIPFSPNPGFGQKSGVLVA